MFRRKVSHSLHLLIGSVLFDALPIDHGRRFAAKGRVEALVIIEIHPLSDTSPGL